MQKVSFAMLVFLVVSGLFPVCHSVSKDKPVKSKEPLTADEIAIYRAILQQNSSQGSEYLNVSIRTFPLDPAFSTTGLSNSDCLKGIKLQNLSDVSLSFHELASDVLSGNNMKLVDPGKQAKIIRNNDPSKTIRKGKSVDSAVDRAFSTALFSLSEIAFDKERRHAVVSYSVWCGSLCGHGHTLIFEKVGSKWKKTDHICGGWIS
jgi:hypothetical protein